MQFLYQKTRKYPFSLLCTAVIWVLSLMKMPEVEVPGVELADKWVHFIMYGGLCGVIWIEYLHCHRRSEYSTVRLFAGAWLLPAIMGGVLELLQAYCTATRSGDWLDFAANTIGVTLAAVIMLPIATFFKR